MTQFQTPEEKSYQENKKKNLETLLADFNCKIDWIWINKASRRKVTFQIDGKNRLGFFAPKSHNLIEIDSDPLAEEKISALIPHLKIFLNKQEQNFYTQVAVTLFDNGLDVVFHGKKALNFSQEQKLMNFAKTQDLNISYRYGDGVAPIFMARPNQIFYPDFKIDLTSDIFIQATKAGLENIVKIIRTSFEKGGGPQRSEGSEDLSNINSESTSKKSSSFSKATADKPVASCHPLFQRGLRVADIYAGFGAYSFAIHDLAKSIFAFEGDKIMTDLIKKNATTNKLSQKIKAETRDLFSNPINKRELKDFDLAIINPPRNGANPQAIEISKSPLKNLIYVSCNPQSFKRDAKILIDSGFKIKSLNAIDQFYATEHLELVSIFQK